MEASLPFISRFAVRIRPIAALSAAALSALLLAGCSSAAPDADPTPSATESAAGDLCASAAPSGSVSDGVVVTGDAGSEAPSRSTAPLEITSAERTVVVEGDGDPIASGDLVQYGATIFDATTGELLESGGYDERDPAGAGVRRLGLGSVLRLRERGRPHRDGPSGHRPGRRLGVGAGRARHVVPPPRGASRRTRWPACRPSSSTTTARRPSRIPEGDAPTEVQIATLKKGDGAVVNPGDTVLVHYTGVKWSDGTVFDSSWDRGTPTSFATTGVVEGFKQALEGQTVGSQVLVVIPPAFGYGAQARPRAAGRDPRLRRGHPGHPVARDRAVTSQRSPEAVGASLELAPTASASMGRR